MRFVDYAWWQVSPATLRSMGFAGAMRYGNVGNTKSITVAEANGLRAAGLDIGIVFEREANRSAQGFAAGHADAVSANQYADFIGYDKNATLWYAVDFDGSAGQVQPYFDGIGSILGRPFAPYGGFAVIDGVRYSAPWGWQTVAWSRGHISQRAGLLQDQFGGNYDSNSVLHSNFGQWQINPAPAPSVIVPTNFVDEGEDMAQVTKRPGGFDGFDCYDVIVDALGSVVGKNANGQDVHVVRSEAHIRTLDSTDADIEVYAPWENPSPQEVGGPAATGSRIACMGYGLLSIVDKGSKVKRDNLLVEYDRICA